MQNQLIKILILILSPFALRAQLVPKEDYISSKRTVATMQHNSDGAAFGPSYLYYNDNIVLLHINDAGNKTIFYKIYSKKFDSVDNVIKIRCYDSALVAKYDSAKLGTITPTLMVTLDYNSSMNAKPFILVDCWFMWKSIRYGFGTDAHTDLRGIADVKRKYPKLINP